MRVLALLAWRRTGNRHGAQDSASARPAAGGADEGLAVVGDPRQQAAWARFGERPLDTGHDTRGRYEATTEELGLSPATARLGKEA